MIYICVPAHNDAKTVGLVLWKIRQVFGSFPREYQLLVANDGSDDATQEVLESYEHVLPMAVVGRTKPLGYARTIEELLRRALRLTDRPKRDCAVTLGGDFRVSPTVVPDLIRRIESGADLVVAGANGGPRAWGSVSFSACLHGSSGRESMSRACVTCYRASVPFGWSPSSAASGTGTVRYWRRRESAPVPSWWRGRQSMPGKSRQSPSSPPTCARRRTGTVRFP